MDENDFKGLSDAEMLELVRELIALTLAGGVSSYSVNGRTFNNLDLDKLKNMENHYEGKCSSGIVDVDLRSC